MWKTGHSLIKQKMTELGCKFGGEMSGHIFFADDYFGYDDAIYVAARLIELLSKTNKSLSELRSIIPVYHSTPEIRMEAKDDEEKFKITKLDKLFQVILKSATYELLYKPNVSIKIIIKEFRITFYNFDIYPSCIL